MKYIRKVTEPTDIEAWEWDETHKMFDKIGCRMMSCEGNDKYPNRMTNLRISTPTRTVKVEKGDFIIKIKHNEYTVCKPKEFKLTYHVTA